MLQVRSGPVVKAPSTNGPQGIFSKMNRATVANRWNLELLEDYHQRLKKDPASVDESWRIFFEGYELGQSNNGPPAPRSVASHDGEVVAGGLDLDAARAQAA